MIIVGPLNKVQPLIDEHGVKHVVTLLAPGKGKTRKPALRVASTKRAPGSLMAGVPASLT